MSRSLAYFALSSSFFYKIFCVSVLDIRFAGLLGLGLGEGLSDAPSWLMISTSLAKQTAFLPPSLGERIGVLLFVLVLVGDP